MFQGKYIDIHTHSNTPEKSGIAIKNLFAHDEIPESGLYSIGWHPWYLNDFSAPEIFNTLAEKASLPQVVAIGETGLDRAINVDWDKQMEVFIFHAKLASRMKKPLIIHCVRAYPELIKVKTELQPKNPWIIHAYRGNVQTTRQLCRHHFYFSFGESLFQQNSKSVQSLLSLPAEKIFMETDESNYSIKSIYQEAVKYHKYTETDLIEQIGKNFQTCFNL